MNKDCNNLFSPVLERISLVILSTRKCFQSAVLIPISPHASSFTNTPLSLPPSAVHSTLCISVSSDHVYLLPAHSAPSRLPHKLACPHQLCAAFPFTVSFDSAPQQNPYPCPCPLPPVLLTHICIRTVHTSADPCEVRSPPATLTHAHENEPF